MPSRVFALLILAVGAIAPLRAAAGTFTDPTTGFALDVPETFALQPLSNASGLKLILTHADALCVVDWAPKRMPFRKQAEVNAFAKPLMIKGFREEGITKPITPFALGDVEGIGAETTLEAPGRPKSTGLVASFATTKGQGQLFCADTIKGYADSKPIFDRLLHSVHLP